MLAAVSERGPGVDVEDADWARFDEELRERKCDALRKKLVTAGYVDVDAVDGAITDLKDVFDAQEERKFSVQGDPKTEDAVEEEKRRADARETLADNFATAVEHPQLAVLLTIYLYAQHLALWELSSDWNAIGQVVAVTSEVVGTATDGLSARDPVEAGLVRSVVELTGSIVPAMAVESGLNCSCPVSMGQAAEDVVATAERVRAGLDELGPGHEHGRSFVGTRAQIDLLYFRTIVAVGSAVLAYVEGGAHVSTVLAAAIDDVSKAERDLVLAGDVYESELRSHRLGLEALVDAWPRLHVDSANVIYCYPFAVPQAEPKAFVEAARAHGADWSPAGVPVRVDDFDVSDMWDGPAPDEQRFAGVALFLPDLTVLTASGEHCFSLELRLGRLGNHYLRVEHRLDDASIHDLNQAMRRAMRQMGRESFAFGGRSFDRIADLARYLIRSLVTHLVPHVDTGDPRHPHHGRRAPVPATEPAEAPVRDVYPHVIVTARQLSLVTAGPDGARVVHRDVTIDDVRQAKGAALLVQPVRQAASILEEWARYAIPDLDRGDVLQAFAFVGDFAYRTTNTTFGLLRGMPEFLILEHEEGAEFVASLPALLESWISQVRSADTSYTAKSTADEINARQLELRVLLTKAHTVMTQLRSADLCLTAVHRELLDRLFEVAGIGRLEDELQAQFAVLDAHYAELSTVLAETRRGEGGGPRLPPRRCRGARRHPVAGRSAPALRQRGTCPPGCRHRRGCVPDDPHPPLPRPPPHVPRGPAGLAVAARLAARARRRAQTGRRRSARTRRRALRCRWTEGARRRPVRARATRPSSTWPVVRTPPACSAGSTTTSSSRRSAPRSSTGTRRSPPRLPRNPRAPTSPRCATSRVRCSAP